MQIFIIIELILAVYGLSGLVTMVRTGDLSYAKRVLICIALVIILPLIFI